jgi:chromosome segregation ATPase
MAAEGNEFITSIISGILTGGAGAATTLVGAFRKTKARIKELEEAVGESEPVKTGLFLTVGALEEAVRKIKREMESWEDAPPTWAERLYARARSNSSSDLSSYVQIEENVNRQLRSFNERLSRAEDDQEAKIRRIEDDVERALAEEPSGKLLTREEYLQDSRMRAEEMVKLRESLATVNGLLRGTMAALGLVDPEGSRPPPRLPPRPGR